MRRWSLIVGIILVIIYILVCLFLVMVVLLQQGKGADLAGAFGGGGSQASFGARSATNIMHRLTTLSFVLFVVLSMTLAILSGKSRKSVMESVQEAAPVVAVEVDTGGSDGSVMDTAEEGPPPDLGLETETSDTGDADGAPGNPADQG
jgi:preprotein translocase subunit SecG